MRDCKANKLQYKVVPDFVMVATGPTSWFLRNANSTVPFWLFPFRSWKSGGQKSLNWHLDSEL